MSKLDSSLLTAVQRHEDACVIVSKFNDVYSKTVHPAVEEFKTYLLVAAIESCHRELVEKLLILNFPLNYKFGYASPSPLHTAVYMGDLDTVEILLQHGALVNIKSRATLRESDMV